MKIGITGATGQLGQIAVSKLKEKVSPDHIVALVRTPEKAAAFGVEARSFDYSKPEDQAEALKGIDTLLLISSSEVGQRETQHKNVIDAAKVAGVKWILYTSVLHVDDVSLGLAPEHIATEKYLKASGIAYTFLRNGWYTENYAVSIPGSIQAGVVIGSAGEGKIAAAPRADFAEAAVAVLTTTGHENKIYELAGDEAFTLTDFAAEISRQTDKNIPYKNLSEEDFSAALRGIGLPEEIVQLLANSDVSASKGDLFDDGRTLSSLIGRPTTPLSEVVKHFI